jgi:hypothetical protein
MASIRNNLPTVPLFPSATFKLPMDGFSTGARPHFSNQAATTCQTGTVFLCVLTCPQSQAPQQTLLPPPGQLQ